LSDSGNDRFDLSFLAEFDGVLESEISFRGFGDLEGVIDVEDKVKVICRLELGTGHGDFF
jgi:hypothetical protein